MPASRRTPALDDYTASLLVGAALQPSVEPPARSLRGKPVPRHRISIGTVVIATATRTPSTREIFAAIPDRLRSEIAAAVADELGWEGVVAVVTTFRSPIQVRGSGEWIEVLTSGGPRVAYEYNESLFLERLQELQAADAARAEAVMRSMVGLQQLLPSAAPRRKVKKSATTEG